MRARITVDPVTGCWLWQGARSGKGYGQFRWNGRPQAVHRVTYALLIGPIPDGLTIDHVKVRGCRHKNCCWPAHLEAVTNRVNQLRGDGLGGINARKERCSKGHEFTPENTEYYRGFRRCRTCRRADNFARWRATEWKGNLPAAQRTHCPQGHEYTPENTRIRKRGHRECRTCARDRQRAQKPSTPSL
jgi:hypothetical protein